MTAAAKASDGLTKVTSLEAAVVPVLDGSVVMVGGFGGAGTPVALREALAERQVRDLTLGLASI